MIDSSNRRFAAAALLALFALSGFAGLIYESIWTQYLGLFLGHAAHAQSFVLMLFMGGMALGAWLASRRSARLARPLAAYALAEIVIGLLGFGFDPIYRGVTGLAYAKLFPLVGSGLALDLARYATALLLIGPQCVLLGMTFPLMSAGYLRLAPSAGGRVLAGLYFTNSLGAALGAIIATFMLLPRVGLPGTVMTGGLVSILVALLTWPLAKQSSTAEPAARHAQAPGLPSAAFVLVAAAITGATSFVYEITWVRMLSLAVGSTVHSFELMLAAFIAGLAFGGWWLRRRADGYGWPLQVAGWAQVFMGLAALGSLFVYMHAFDWVAALWHGLAHSDGGYALYNVATSMIAFAVMFPAAFFAGMTLPLLTLALLRRGEGEAAIGRAYAANTLGAIAGVLLTVHLLMPLLGVRVALWLAAVADLLLGLYLLARGREGAGAVRRDLRVAAAVSLLVAVVALAATRVDERVLASSVYRLGRASLSADTRMLFYGDGKTATVAMYESADGSEYAIATNGKVDAALTVDLTHKPTTDEYTMLLLAALPLAAHPAPKDVAVVGFGSGMSVNTLLGDPRVQRVDAIEIEPFMVKAAQGFGPRVERAYSDPRAHIIIDDAKAYLSGSPRNYDVIVSEPSNPWVSGVATLFTEQFYEFVPRHLAEDGLFVQWLQLYEISPDLVASILKAMLPRFADVQAYASNNGDLVLIATRKGAVPPLRDLALQAPQLAPELTRLSMASAAQMREFFLMDRTGLASLARLSPMPANSDFFPVVQLRAPAARFAGASATDISAIADSPWPLLEATGAYVPPPVSVAQGVLAPWRLRSLQTQTARAIRLDLLAPSDPGEGVGQLGADVELTLLRSVARQCDADDAAFAAWALASAKVAGRTLPFLRSEDLHGVWIEPQWLLSCWREQPRVGRLMAFHAAAAARDWPAVVNSGEVLLDDPELAALAPLRTFVARYVELALVVLGDMDALARFEQRRADLLPRDAFGRRWLLEVALIKAEGAVTVTQPAAHRGGANP